MGTTTGRARAWALAAVASAALGASACSIDDLGSDDEFGNPPTAGDTFDPDQGGDGGSTTGTGGGDAGEDTSSETTGPPECADENKRCPHEFSLLDQGYGNVTLIGDFSPSGWDVGLGMGLDGGTWRVTADVPWDTPVLYKFKIDDGAQYIPDPDNPNQVEDGFGGFNSVLDGQTCEDWTCDPGLIGDFDWRDSVIYFVFVDRFNNGDPGNDGPIGVEALADWQGGDWAGVTAKIEEGYFGELGVNTLWLSVPLDNTNVSGQGNDGYFYSAYHAYWPQNLDATEEHFGTLAELQQLVDAAHERDIKVIIDYAMNHVHDTAPVYADHPEWFWPNDNGEGGNCVCGEGCSWGGDQGRRCWFTGYLPDFNFTNAEARAFSVDNATQWILDTGVDGFRLDAVKHIEDSWLIDMRARVAAEIEPMTGEHFYMVGETFDGDRDTIAYYVQPSMLDGQFDFPLRMELASKLIMRQGSMSELAGFMDSNDDYYGAGIMSTFIGNHDIPRVVHLAEDIPLWDNAWTDGKDMAWTNIPLPGNEAPFERLALGFTLIFTIPGAPLIYYGDEYGMPGGGDPDNRRFMQWSGYSSGQQGLRDHLEQLTTIRAEQTALRRGSRTTLSADQDTLVYEMSYANDMVVVALNRADGNRSAGGLPGGSWVDLLSGQVVSGTSVDLPARTSMILVPQ
ncbi:glycosyl hydrolase, family 13 [Plesiocystis pacifica SIR-1]|uniref:Glycosyl hydrolase, family 13 n=2 Tax=Plesiocystis pacifica TaxID=191768 RepID=A6GEG2_9BACT|nr:glycosyl hydrolase, family 13 [Plesiocystis pacifica SIR-1]